MYRRGGWVRRTGWRQLLYVMRGARAHLELHLIFMRGSTTQWAVGIVLFLATRERYWMIRAASYRK
jgi:hypothetical protein